MNEQNINIKNRHYILDDVSWWDSNGCSCCEPILMEAYSFRDEVLLNRAGTQRDEEGIAREILIYNKHLPENYNEDESTWEYWDSFDYIAFASALGYTWEIVNGIDTEE